MSLEARAAIQLVYMLVLVLLSFLIMTKRRATNRWDRFGVLLVFLGSLGISVAIGLVLYDRSVMTWPYLWAVSLILAAGWILLLYGRLKHDRRRQ